MTPTLWAKRLTKTTPPLKGGDRYSAAFWNSVRVITYTVELGGAFLPSGRK